MVFAVELYFDPETEQSIRQVRQALTEQGAAVVLDALGGARPHISLAVFGAEADSARLIELARVFAAQSSPFEVQLSAVGAFPSEENVLFLAPVPTLRLLSLHQEFHRRLAKAEFQPSPYYLPDAWVPHCTIDMNLPAEQFPKALNICKQVFKPLRGQFREIGVIEFRPFRCLATFAMQAVRPDADHA